MGTEIVYEAGQNLLTSVTSAASYDGAPSHAHDTDTLNTSNVGGGVFEEIESVAKSLCLMFCLISSAFLRCTDSSVIGKNPGLS